MQEEYKSFDLPEEVKGIDWKGLGVGAIVLALLVFAIMSY